MESKANWSHAEVMTLLTLLLVLRLPEACP